MSMEALLTASGNIVVELLRLDLEDFCGQAVGGNGTKASSVAGSEGEGRDGAERAHSAAWKNTCRPSQSESPERMPRIGCSVFV